MKNKKHFGYIFITGLLFSSLAILPDPGQNELKRSIVQVRVTNQAPNYLYPWQAKTPRSHGAVGIVVNGNRILVLTSQISNFSLIEVKKFSSFNAYRASLIKSDFESNLTLLEIEDKDFFSDTVPVRFEKKISIRDNVTFYQLDNAGTLQSAKGRITGLDMDASTLGHTELPYLDINSNEKLDGNGELILEKGNPAGIVTEFTANKNSGKGLPGFVINSFLKSANSKEATNFPHKGFRFRALVDSATKEYFGLNKNGQGVIVAEIIPRTGASEALLIDDIIIEFGGMKIDSKGYFDHPEFGKQSLSFLSNCGEEFGFIAGKTIPVKLLRNKKEISVHMPLRIFPYDSIRIPYANNGGKPPVYLIKSGFIFLELSEFLLREWGNNWRTRVDRKLLYLTDYHKLHRGKETGKIVLLAQVLPDDSNNGYHGLSFKIVESVNGEAIASVPDLNRRILSSKENLALISLESGIEIVIDKSKSDEIDRKIMEKFRINKLKNF